MSNDWFLIVPSPFLSALVWIVVLVVALYFAREPAHRMILSLTRTLHGAFRLSASSVMRAHTKLAARNREVLLAQGREAAERMIEREFERIDATVRRDLSEYPALHRQITHNIAKIEDDHQQSAQIPPEPPGWVKAVQAIAKIPPNGDPMVSKTLELVHKSMVESQTRAEADYRTESQKRHQLLANMMPQWRRVDKLLKEVDRNANALLDRSRIIDRHMDEYQEIVRGTERAERQLSSSSLVQFFVSLFVMAIATGGAIINFNLIARPMSEMVGGNSMIGGFRTADIAALVIIFVELSMGLFLMEALRITRLFPVIGALTDKWRIIMGWCAFIILFSLACVEAGLAYMREILLQDELATSALLRGEAASFDTTFLWITTGAQMGMGFILPFALVFVAIPLETFVHSLRTVMGLIGAWALQMLAYGLRLVGNVFRHGGELLVDFYDMVVFVPLWLERQWRQRRANAGADSGPEPVARTMLDDRPTFTPAE